MRMLVRQMYPTADGIQLAADVYLPDGPGPFPVVLCRTPYDRVGHLGGWAKSFVPRGYAYVATDCRGRFESEGVFTRPFEEVVDGKATLDWIGNQSWCNGRIGLWGRSYGGVFQAPAAISGHPALRCMCPAIICAQFFQNWCRYDGCFALRNPLWWLIQHGTGRTKPQMEHIDFEALHHMQSLDEVEAAVGFPIAMLREMADHDTDDAYWQRIDQYPMHEQIGIPALHSGGWFDHVTSGAFEAYERIRDLGATPAARTGQRLFIGPWGHISYLQTGDTHRRYGNWDFGEVADVSTVQHDLRFFDLHLRDIDDGIGAEAPVRVFLMGENRWLDLPDWPPPGHELQSWHLSSAGNAHGTRGDGRLQRETAAGDAADTLVYDPCRPLPTWGGQIFWGLDHKGPQDQRWLLERDDVLYYASDPLPQPLTIIGRVGLELTIATDVDDTDVIAKLCVVEADGAVTSLVVGSFRCRYRDGWDKRVPLVHDEPTKLSFRLSDLAYTFAVGSRIALMISSSDYPRIQPHSNTMVKPWQPAEPVIAHTRVLHGPSTVCQLMLPVVPG